MTYERGGFVPYEIVYEKPTATPRNSRAVVAGAVFGPAGDQTGTARRADVKKPSASLRSIYGAFD
jgi:hypothetical protein